MHHPDPFLLVEPARQPKSEVTPSLNRCNLNTPPTVRENWGERTTATEQFLLGFSSCGRVLKFNQKALQNHLPGQAAHSSTFADVMQQDYDSHHNNLKVKSVWAMHSAATCGGEEMEHSSKERTSRSSAVQFTFSMAGQDSALWEQTGLQQK